jgi:hypothetical protein
MLKRLTVLLALAGLGATAGEAARDPQSESSAIRPDFSGTWTVVSLTNTPPGEYRTYMWTPPVKMTQDAKTLILEYVSGGRNHAPVKLVYSLDGSEGKGVDRNGPSPYDLLIRAEWRSTRLALNTMYLREKQGNIETTEVLRLDSPATMTVETTWKLGDLTRTSVSTWRR